MGTEPTFAPYQIEQKKASECLPITSGSSSLLRILPQVEAFALSVDRDARPLQVRMAGGGAHPCGSRRFALATYCGHRSVPDPDFALTTAPGASLPAPRSGPHRPNRRRPGRVGRGGAAARAGIRRPGGAGRTGAARARTRGRGALRQQDRAAPGRAIDANGAAIEPPRSSALS
jgi:hypothetical protein